MVHINIVNGVYIPTYNWGAPSSRNVEESQMTLDMPRFEVGEMLWFRRGECPGESVDLGRIVFRGVFTEPFAMPFSNNQEMVSSPG